MPDPQTIIIADDDKDLLKALTLRLWNEGYEIVTATDSYNALSLAAESKPDLLILDVNMPAGDGFSVHERLQSMGEDFKDTPVIYITGDKSPRLEQIAEDHGGIRLFHKPFQLEELLTTIKQVLLPKAA